MDGYVSETEQVEQIWRWWKDNGRALVLGLVVGLGGLAGYRYWDAAQTARAESASINYQQFLQLAGGDRTEDAVKTGRAIVDGYPDTTYARLSTLLLAKLAVEKNDYPQAKIELKKLVDDGGAGEIGNVARARLARILLAEGAADEADKFIAAVPAGTSGDRDAELRADIHAARGQIDAARTQYLLALAAAEKLGLDRDSIQIKLDNLPSAKSHGS